MKTVVLTGPESSGKTTLASALSKHFGVPWAPEFARYYLQHLGAFYTPADLRTIGAGQKAWEHFYRNLAGLQKSELLFLDTDWTVLHVWESHRFGDIGNLVLPGGYGELQTADLYLLCKPDLPWHPDPLRENPDDRDVLFDKYLLLLEKFSLPFKIIEGAEGRVESAVGEVEKLLLPLHP